MRRAHSSSLAGLKGLALGDEDGIETIEVAFIAALVVVIILAAVPLLTGGIDGAFGMISERFADIESGG